MFLIVWANLTLNALKTPQQIMAFADKTIKLQLSAISGIGMFEVYVTKPYE
jgi:hypothetical protein